jgi:hypothetical protein
LLWLLYLRAAAAPPPGRLPQGSSTCQVP